MVTTSQAFTPGLEKRTVFQDLIYMVEVHEYIFFLLKLLPEML